MIKWCNKCELVYMNPRPSDMSAYYPQEYAPHKAKRKPTSNQSFWKKLKRFRKDIFANVKVLPFVKKKIDEIWSDEVTSVEFDFSTVDFIDSSGIGALLGVYKRLPSKNASVKLCNVKAPVQAVIELLRLHRIFEIVS